MELRVVPHGDLGKRGFSKLGTFLGDSETPAFQITNREACSVRVDKIADFAPAIRQDGGFVLAVHELAVVDQQPSGNAMTERF